MSDILYLKAERSIKIENKEVKIKNIAKIECTNCQILNKVKELIILTIKDKTNNKYVISVLKIIELIHGIYPELEINNVGEMDFVIEYVQQKKNLLLEYIEVLLICLIVFTGAAFTIMTFNNDVAVERLFAQVYSIIMNEKTSGFTILEMSYSIGLGAGILVFYNHIGGRKLTTDPTPIQVEMRIYEDEVNTALIKNYTREDKRIDVS
ncbi:stage V sporulation protein AA [Lachnotalea glycerini]|uniref:Stage V sporulation protein AA n=1 Tax=Lachnotalea glycerini TaxID=1763509 RepID=A0A255M7D5_9FIRM|nr:stage V sporulation protein AA [Lachnotalea glycerini]OYO84465.1 stage V sporulation protein AA [Lachnotalea glycerini]PXV85983.1 stage V sporulation protein AA [Lachnotalea glycerini]RDY31415.1 stage V sporulation protein AA [Lachnotalea glycerini]